MATIIDWPADLPDCPQTWQEQDAPDIVRTEMDIGLPKQRRRSTLRKTNVSVQWTLDKQTHELFDQFYYTTLQQGIFPFYYNHPETGAQHSYTFAEAPAYNYIPGDDGVVAVAVTATLELRA